MQDPVTLHLLDPSHEQQDRFQPLPERAIRNGRPRTLYVHAGRMASRPQSPTRGGPCRPHSATSRASMPRAARRPQSAAAWRRGDGVSDAVQAHLKGRVPQRDGSAGGSPSGVVPGFEMSGVTAHDLQGAGILYAAEAPLLQGRPKAAQPLPSPAPPLPPQGDQQAATPPLKSKVCLVPPPFYPTKQAQHSRKPIRQCHAWRSVAIMREL